MPKAAVRFASKLLLLSSVSQKSTVSNITVSVFLIFWLDVCLQGTLDVGLIDSVCAADNPDR